MKNLTVGSPTKLLLAFTLPLVAGGLLQQAYQITDAAVVGRVLGPDGLAAVGSVGSLIFLLIGFAWGATAGLAIPVSKFFGADDLPQTRRAIASGAFVTLGIAALVTSIGVLGSRAILTLLGTPDYLMADAVTYLRITTGGAIFTICSAFLFAVVRAVGDAKRPLMFGIGSQLLNAVLVVIFVAHLHLGVAGAALTTIIAQATTLTAALIYLRLRMADLIPRRAEWRAGLRQIGESARVGFPMGLQTCAIALGVVALQAAVNTLGGDAIAAYAAAGRVEGVVISPLHAFNMALITFVAQNRGAKQWPRIRQAVARAGLIVGALAICLGALQFIFAAPMIGLFLHAEVGAPVAMAVSFLRLTAFLFIILGIKFVVRGAVQGMGNSAIPTISTFVELGIRITVALVLVGHLGLLGVALAAPLAWSSSLLINGVTWLRIRRRLIEAVVPAQAGVTADLRAGASAADDLVLAS